MSAPPIVLFDCDGTLADSPAAIVAATQAAFASQGLAPPPGEAVRRYIGRAAEAALADLLADLAIDPASLDRSALAAAYRSAYKREREARGGAEPLYAGLAELVARLDRSGYVLGIVTGKSRRGLGYFLNGNGLAGHFLATRTADDGPGKPDPAPVLDCLAELGGAPAATAVVGDTTFDMTMAANAGAHPLGVAWGCHDAAALRAAGAAWVADTAGDLAAALAARLPNPVEAD